MLHLHITWTQLIQLILQVTLTIRRINPQRGLKIQVSNRQILSRINNRLISSSSQLTIKLNNKRQEVVSNSNLWTCLNSSEQILTQVRHRIRIHPLLLHISSSQIPESRLKLKGVKELAAMLAKRTNQVIHMEQMKWIKKTNRSVKVPKR
jgi:hypothetical protein